ncbi:MAG: hypothetical protein RLZZ360_70 [Candidatus Parcubacteria bacterium]|jgi:hypothetical protein
MTDYGQQGSADDGQGTINPDAKKQTGNTPKTGAAQNQQQQGGGNNPGQSQQDDSTGETTFNDWASI